MMQIKIIKKLLLMMITLICFLLSGCWSNRGVEDLGVVTVDGWDIVTIDGAEKWQISLIFNIPQTANQNQNTQSRSSQGAASQGGSTESFLFGYGDDLKEGFNDIMKRISRYPFYEHIGATIFGANCAKISIVDATEDYIRYQTTRPNDLLFATKGEALQILKCKPALSSSLSEQILKISLKNAQSNGASCKISFSDFANTLLSSDRDAVLPEIEPIDPNNGESVPTSVLIEGFAVFSGSKLAGWLDINEARGFLFTTNNFKGGEIALSFILDEKRYGFWLNKTKCKIKAEFIDNKPSFTITIKAAGVLYHNRVTDLTVATEQILQEKLSEKIQGFVLDAVAKSKEYNSDFLGLMQQLHRTKPSVWSKIKSNWRDYFQNSQINVKVETTIINGGQINSNAFKVKQ